MRAYEFVLSLSFLTKAHKNLLVTAFTFSLLYSPFVVSGSIYKWTDESGRVHFSDKPTESGSVEEIGSTRVAPKAPRTTKIEDVNDRETNAKLTRAVEEDASRRMLKLPDGTEYPMPRTEAEGQAFKEAVRNALNRMDSRDRNNKIQPQDTPQYHTPLNSSSEVARADSEIYKRPHESSFDGASPQPVIKVLDGKLKKRRGQNGIDAVELPVTAGSVFNECNQGNLKRGTRRSRLCDLWDEHLVYLNNRLERACSVAGERIYKTVSNVDGVFLNTPYLEQDNPKQRYINNGFHESASKSINNYMAPLRLRMYRTFEYYDVRKNTYITKSISGIRYGQLTSSRRHLAKVDTTSSESNDPQSRYEVSYKHLTSQDDRDKGFYGDKTWVKDRVTNELLAERIIYYFVIKAGRMDDGTRLDLPGSSKNMKGRVYYPCQDYVPRASHFDQQYPRDEYEFVSRVLAPTPYTQDENTLLYDLSNDDRETKRRCIGMQTVGAGITPNDLKVKRVGDDLRLSFYGGAGSLTCTSFFRGPHWDLSLMFSDGVHWNEKQILKHGNISSEKY